MHDQSRVAHKDGIRVERWAKLIGHYGQQATLSAVAPWASEVWLRGGEGLMLQGCGGTVPAYAVCGMAEAETLMRSRSDAQSHGSPRHPVPPVLSRDPANGLGAGRISRCDRSRER